MTDDTGSVRVTMREVYDMLVRLDTKVTQLNEARVLEAERREDMGARMDKMEQTLESLRVRVLAWPSLAGAAAVVAIVVAIAPRVTA